MKTIKCPSVNSKNAVSNRKPNSALANFPNINETTNALDKNLYIVDASSRTTYLKGRLIGKGGFARVYELTDLTTGQVYAGKIIRKSRANNPHYKDKLESEINLHRNLNHLHVVRFYCHFQYEGNIIIILEHCPNKSLMQLMHHRTTLTEPEVLFYLRQLIFGLRYIHANNIVHQDLKLANILLSESMTVKICDFGLAARFHSESEVFVGGTPNYMAPEVINRERHSYEVDLWAVGCIMYAMLVGRPPFETWSLTETYSRITHNIYEIPPSVTRPARSLIRQLLAPEPLHRPTLDQVLQHDFFIYGHIPASLPAWCCYKPPNVYLVPPKTITLQPLNKAKLIDSLLPVPYQTKGEVGVEMEKQNKLKQYYYMGSPAAAVSHSPLAFVGGSQPSLYTALFDCFTTAPISELNPSPVSHYQLFISKWADFSAKYGFGFQLSDLSVGIQFNDQSRMSYSRDRTVLQFQDWFGQTSSYLITALPTYAYFEKRFKILRYITEYMEKNLLEGCSNTICPPTTDDQLSFVHVKRFKRMSNGIAMQLNNGTLQINFSKDHSKVVLSSSTEPSSFGLIHYWVTYINSDRLSVTYKLSDIAQQGCESRLRRRLLFALNLLREFEESDRGQSNNDPTVHKRKRNDDDDD